MKQISILTLFILTVFGFKVNAQSDSNSGCWSLNIEQIAKRDCDTSNLAEYVFHFKVDCGGKYVIYIQKERKNSITGELKWNDLSSHTFDETSKIWDRDATGLKIGEEQKYRFVCVSKGTRTNEINDNSWYYETIMPSKKCK